MSEERIVYGANCVWWDSIDKASTIDGEPGGLPCCPHCRGVLLEIKADKWEKGVRDLAEKESGYDELIAWMRGKCFPTYPEAMAAYEEEKGVSEE